jgi:hypothetical protein
MSAEPYDGIGRFTVPSASKPSERHMVDLLALNGNGRCSCEDFTCRKGPLLASGFPMGDKTRCKHIKSARDLFLDTVIRQLLKTHTAGKED